jgi:peptidoglycan/LPS O-acetylase OafA/YrhL
LRADSTAKAPETGQTRPRFAELDGLRAVAMLAVLLFHYLQRYPADYPYGDGLLPVAQHGWLGVYLFFIISGFVIALTLNCSRSPFEFAVRRIARLLPAMLLCATLTFLVLWWIDTPFTRTYRTGLASFLPSLSFTDPWLWQWLVPGVAYIDGAYWSLFVEIRFYFWAGLIFFLFGRERFLRIFLTGALIAIALYPAFDNGPLHMPALLLFFPDHLPFFCIGMIVHALWSGYREADAIPATILFAGLSIWSVASHGIVPAALVALMIAGFMALVWRPHWLAPLAHPAVTLIGACSYSLYLLHQNIGVALISLLPRAQPTGFYVTALILITLLMAALAFLVFRVVEQPAQAIARRWLARGRSVEVRPVAIV